MKKVLSAATALLLILSLAACGDGTSAKHEIPDVFGIDYTEAIAILEADGFEVKAVATGVGSFSDKLLYPLKKVDQGTVFKIDDYIIDNNGNLNKNYDVFYDGGLVSGDKSVVIYYAQDDYVRETDKPAADQTPNQDSVPAPTESPVIETESPIIETDPTESAATEATEHTGLRPEFKEAMDSYEAFMDEYVAFMKKYLENPTDIRLISDYSKFMTEYTEFAEAFEKWESEDLNTAELAYYIEVQTRVTQKLLEIA